MRARERSDAPTARVRETNAPSGATKTYETRASVVRETRWSNEEEKLLRCHDKDLPRDGCRLEGDGASKHACAARETWHAVAPKRIASRSSY